MKIPFSLPLINQDVVSEMMDTLTNTGWVTTGPKTQRLEQEISKITLTKDVLCVNSWTSGAMLTMRWFGIGPGDEVIIPSYTYAATALSVLNIGAKPIMVDVQNDFTICPEKITEAISNKTKAIIPVDLGGFPADYDKIYKTITEPDILKLFLTANERQKKLSRILVIADAAHSFGAFYKNKEIGRVADVTILSFHSAKNITTGEGGGICLNLPEPFINHNELSFLRSFSLNGQNKSAFEKNKIGGWKYDITDQGMKVNMPDLCAAMGLAQIRKYRKELLPERRRIFDFYTNTLKEFDWAIIPPFENSTRVSSYHLYLLRIRDINEEQRDRMIQLISEESVGVNVHYIPMPLLSLFKNLGYKIEDYPMTYKLYSNEITLPVYNGLTIDQLAHVTNTVIAAYNSLI